MEDKQLKFERNIILESELSKNAYSESLSIDDMNTFKTVSDLNSEDEDYIRSFLFIIISEKIAQLSNIQKRIAKMWYIDKKTYREISEILNIASTSTINHHLKKIKEIIKSF